MSEKLVRWVQLLHHDPKSKLRSVAGISEPLRVFADIHQGIDRLSLFFVLIIDTVTRGHPISMNEMIVLCNTVSVRF